MFSPCDFDDKVEMYEFYRDDRLRSEGWYHSDELPNMTNVKDWIKDLSVAAFETGDQDVFVDRLLELCNAFKIEIPSYDVQL